LEPSRVVLSRIFLLASFVFMGTVKSVPNRPRVGANHGARFHGGGHQGDSKASTFLQQLAEEAKRHGHIDAAVQTRIERCRRFILFHGKRHPKEMAHGEIGAF
jgi:hypothetical protein